MSAASAFDPLSRESRLVRSLVFSVLSVSLGAAAHSIAMGVLVPWWVVLGSAVLLFGIAYLALSLRECSLLALAPTVVATQLALHVGLSAATGMPSMPMSWLCGIPGASTTVLPAIYSHPVMHGASHEQLLMLLGHAGAALAVAVWLRAGERATFALVASLTLTLGALVCAILGAVVRLCPRPECRELQRTRWWVDAGWLRPSSRSVPVQAGRAPPLALI